MHEMSLFRDLMGKVESISRQNRGKKILKLRVWLGALCHLSAPHFQEHFEELSPGTAAEGADLEIEVSRDQKDPLAQQVVLLSVEIEA